jgi:NIMA (never in mitosis gene a)-related kinase
LQLHHSNIVRCVESFVEEEKLLIVMEYADGGDLGAAIERRRNQRRHFSEVVSTLLT